MPFWQLRPLDVAADYWRASTYQGDVLVRATREAEARSTAIATFFTAYPRTPGDPLLFSPWGQPALVRCQRVEGVPYADHGPATVVSPCPHDERRG
jgi:hypothetical protein